MVFCFRRDPRRWLWCSRFVRCGCWTSGLAGCWRVHARAGAHSAGAAGWVPYALTAGFWTEVVLAESGHHGVAAPERFDRAGLANVGLCVLAVTAVAGPGTGLIASMQEFWLQHGAEVPW